eukprot:190719_1
MSSYSHHLFLLICLYFQQIHGKQLIKSQKVNVFNKGENGYFCIKIPDIILTTNNTLIAFGEARMESCSDYAWTDLVYKRSTDGGKTWSPLKILHSNSTINNTNVIGNAAPIQCSITKRIFVPHCKNNREVWFMHSNDDGLTWSQPTGPYTHLTKSDWKWVGLGPPAGLQLKSNNRIIIPSYHSVPHIDGDLSKGHIIYSDDYGMTWNLSQGIFGLGEDNNHEEFFPSESQAIELKNGSVLINSRGESIYRIASISNDFGNTFEPSYYFNGLLDEMSGCEGSMIKHDMSGYLYYSGIAPDINDTELLRYNMSIAKSKDDGNTWEYIDVIDGWSSAYSALIALEKESNDDQDTIGILYEDAEIVRVVFIPDHITFQILTFSH